MHIERFKMSDCRTEDCLLESLVLSGEHIRFRQTQNVSLGIENQVKIEEMKHVQSVLGLFDAISGIDEVFIEQFVFTRASLYVFKKFIQKKHEDGSKIAIQSFEMRVPRDDWNTASFQRVLNLNQVQDIVTFDEMQLRRMRFLS